MKVAIMQPYLFPYIGYFQLINSVDKFIIYDNIQFTKKAYQNNKARNYSKTINYKKTSTYWYTKCGGKIG